MMHKPIQIKSLDLSFSHKTCFNNFNFQIAYGSRIGIIGRNGSGKSTLLKIIAGYFDSSDGAIIHSEDLIIGYVPQVIEDHVNLSGGERLNRVMTEALSLDPNVLLLDEPTNHLDRRNRKSLMRMLQNYHGTLIVVSHDTELLSICIDKLWHIDNGNIHVFSGNYDNYIYEIKLKRASIESELALLNRQKKDMHHKLMQEQQRAAKSKLKGEKSIDQRKWPTIVSKSKALRAEETSGRKKSSIDKRKYDLIASLAELRIPEIIIPKFSIGSSEVGARTLIQIGNGSVGYSIDVPLLSGISLNLSGDERMAITGDNRSGKSTLIKAILGDDTVYKTGDWLVIKREDIGYLDQHYSTLQPHKSVLETISERAPYWSHAKIRCHLNDFLFRKNEEVNSPIRALSGGEKARLSLAQIAACSPKLLILDEITNNLDLETREHVIQVLKAYPGAMIVISHDADFLEEVGVDTYFKINGDY
ncbi:ABC-F family ATP-binding cassette domain-containing protein [Candidatus Nucleicultrix amoebiphila]|jgi:ATPase subunit of ABC transporter with duplicated ATPase domains|nr:ATP-binding cassette domain-containing protein [Candidatus Nucleicultrix amoebiphila]